jgi:hypothetical protein
MPPKTLSARKRIDVVYRINRNARLCKTFQVCGDAYCSSIYKRLKNPKIAFEFLGHGSQGIGIWDKVAMHT